MELMDIKIQRILIKEKETMKSSTVQKKMEDKISKFKFMNY